MQASEKATGPEEADAAAGGDGGKDTSALPSDQKKGIDGAAASALSACLSHCASASLSLAASLTRSLIFFLKKTSCFMFIAVTVI